MPLKILDKNQGFCEFITKRGKKLNFFFFFFLKGLLHLSLKTTCVILGIHI